MYLESGTLEVKTTDSYSIKNSMLTDIYRDVHYEFVPQGQAVNKQYYTNML
jgi:hypothetical protein